MLHLSPIALPSMTIRNCPTAPTAILPTTKASSSPRIATPNSLPTFSPLAGMDQPPNIGNRSFSSDDNAAILRSCLINYGCQSTPNDSTTSCRSRRNTKPTGDAAERLSPSRDALTRQLGLPNADPTNSGSPFRAFREKRTHRASFDGCATTGSLT